MLSDTPALDVLRSKTAMPGAVNIAPPIRPQMNTIYAGQTPTYRAPTVSEASRMRPADLAMLRGQHAAGLVRGSSDIANVHPDFLLPK